MKAKFSKLLLGCAIVLLYASSVMDGEFITMIIGVGCLGMWYEYEPN